MIALPVIAKARTHQAIYTAAIAEITDLSLEQIKSLKANAAVETVFLF